jgi:hypothetical protein
MSSLDEASATRISPLCPASDAVLVADRQRTCLFVFIRKLAFLPTCQHARLTTGSVISGNKFITNVRIRKSMQGGEYEMRSQKGKESTHRRRISGRRHFKKRSERSYLISGRRFALP